ncbi:MAG: hypothetical protein LZF62_180038 [Nitrospira sp.]|nr:MAG: hypothetical protein LZF62_180038 [Nitrospira sp.]
MPYAAPSTKTYITGYPHAGQARPRYWICENKSAQRPTLAALLLLHVSSPGHSTQLTSRTLSMQRRRAAPSAACCC